MKCNLKSEFAKLARENGLNLKNKNLNYDLALSGLQMQYFHDLETDKKHTLLDIGCAYGTQSAMFSKLGYDVTAIDCMKLSNSKFLKKYNVKYSLKNLETDEIKGKYDVVVLSEVLEHLNYNPYKPLLKIRELLNDGGFLIVSTPVGENPIHRNAKEAKDGRYTNYAHYRDIPEAYNGYKFIDAHHHLYNRVELIQLLHESGFNISECFTANRGSSHYVIAYK